MPPQDDSKYEFVNAAGVLMDTTDEQQPPPQDSGVAAPAPAPASAEALDIRAPRARLQRSQTMVSEQVAAAKAVARQAAIAKASTHRAKLRTQKREEPLESTPVEPELQPTASVQEPAEPAWPGPEPQSEPVAVPPEAPQPPANLASGLSTAGERQWQTRSIAIMLESDSTARRPYSTDDWQFACGYAQRHLWIQLGQLH